MIAKSSDQGQRAVPRHVAIIMDGNGRWAESRGLSRVHGHRQGAVTVRKIIEAALNSGIEILTLFAFSSENWKRPRLEVTALMELFAHALNDECERMIEHGIRMKVLGDLSKFSESLCNKIKEVQNKTANGQRMQLNIAANYGGRWDIVQAAVELAKSGKNPDEWTEADFNAHLSSTDSVDLLIRTGGESRISNFLLWQCSYAEFYFSAVLWPDFGAEHLQDAIEFFRSRERRFGMTSQQVAEQRDAD